MEPYTPAELERVLDRSAGLLGVALQPGGGAEIAGRSRGTPRIANRLLRRVRDYAEVRTGGRVDLRGGPRRPAVYDVDELGLDRLDRAVLEALVRRFGGGPVGLSTLAVAVSEEARDGRGGRRAVPGPQRAGRCAPRAAGSRPRPPGSTSACARPAPGRARAAAGDARLRPGAGARRVASPARIGRLRPTLARSNRPSPLEPLRGARRDARGP